MIMKKLKNVLDKVSFLLIDAFNDDHQGEFYKDLRIIDMELTEAYNELMRDKVNNIIVDFKEVHPDK